MDANASPSTTTLQLFVSKARKLDKGAFSVKIRYGDDEQSTKKTKTTAKNLVWNETLTFKGPANESLKISVYKTDAKGKRAVVARGMIKVSDLKENEENVRLRLRSKVYPNATLIMNVSKSNAEESQAATLNQFYKLIVDPSHEVLKAICESSSVIDMDEMAFSLVALYLDNASALRMIKWAISEEIRVSEGEELLFRGQSIYVKLVSDYAAIVGKEYIVHTLRPILTQMSKETETKNISWEVNPERAGKALKNNRKKLLEFASKFLNTILQSEKELPTQIREACRVVSSTVESKYPESVNTVLGGFLFLRFICPAIVTPEQCKLIDTSPSLHLRRGLVLCAKLLQNLACGNTFGEKESFMEEFNPFITSHLKAINSYFGSIRAKGAKKVNEEKKELSSPQKQEYLLQISGHIAENKERIMALLSEETRRSLQQVAALMENIKPSPDTDDLKQTKSAFFNRFQSIFRY